ncbi:MAG: ABC transporter permease [Coriobacteriia bacterium]|nr:ABC transporter permease [Coriobacteriia bacterium]
MLRYAIKRVLQLIPILIGVSMLVFLIMQLTPGDPAKLILGPRASQETLEAYRRELGLHLPIWQQYLNWIGNVLRGNLGNSLHFKKPVTDLIMERLAATLILSIASMILATVFGVVTGVISATKQYSLADRTMMTLALIGFCLPVFWFGLLLQFVFSIRLGWFPASGINSPGVTGWQDMAWHLVLPSIALAVGAMATIARMTRSSMLEVIRQDYIRTARAKGVSWREISYNHALRNALIPVVTVVGSQFGYLLSGQILLEVVFNWPGLGQLMVNGIMYRDFPLVQGTVLVVAAMYVVVNLIVDLLYGFLDPRIKYEEN